MVREDMQKNKICNITFIISTLLIFVIQIFLKELDYKQIIYYGLFMPVLIHASCNDIKEKKIPLLNLIIMLVTAVTLIIIVDINNVLQSIITSLIIFLVLTIISFVAKGGFGMGDVYLISSLSVFIGLNRTILMMFFSLLICSLFGISLLVMKKLDRKTKIPFTPFIILGYLLIIGG